MSDLSQIKKGAKGAGHISAAQAATLFGAALVPRALEYIDGVTTVDALAGHRAIFLEREDDRYVAMLSLSVEKSLLVFAPASYLGRHHHAQVVTDEPRRLFAQLVRELFHYSDRFRDGPEPIHSSAVIHPTAHVAPGVAIGPNCRVGAGTTIMANTVLGPDVRIGERCLVMSCTVIGQPGFGTFKPPSGELIHMPHVGGVVIGNDVEIGALTTICSGTIHPTIVLDGAHIDDHVHIAHNCIIESGSEIIACAEVSGSVHVKRNAWISPNASVRDGLVIGEGALVGLGAVVVKDVADGDTVVGNPARPLSRKTVPTS